jgi:hypothetical protein
MSNWKRALIFGSLGVGAVLLATGKRPAGFALAGIGVAALAAEYPEQFDRIWRSAPDYLERGTELVGRISDVGRRLTEEASRFGHRRERGTEYVT